VNGCSKVCEKFNAQFEAFIAQSEDLRSEWHIYRSNTFHNQVKSCYENSYNQKSCAQFGENLCTA